MLSSFSF